ncbi:hypothetical protein [Niastella vici]|nr:hypothetical protein [Niastella vici]
MQVLALPKTHSYLLICDNPNDASDAVKDRDGDGYTNIEEYINSVVKVKM